MSFLRIVERPLGNNLRKTKLFDVQNVKGENLGVIGFHPAWRKFVFEAQPKMIFDASCLTEIVGFLVEETARWKEGLKW